MHRKPDTYLCAGYINDGFSNDIITETAVWHLQHCMQMYVQRNRFALQEKLTWNLIKSNRIQFFITGSNTMIVLVAQ